MMATKHPVKSRWILMLAGIACALLSGSAAFAAPESAALPSPEPGTQWIYAREVVSSGKSAQTRLTVLSMNGSIAHCEISALDTGKTEKFDFDYARYAPTASPQGSVILKFPVKPGDHWEGEYQRTEPIPKHPEAVMKIEIAEFTTVGQWETVRVPAGNFWALRVERSVHENISGPGIGSFARATKMVYWYAPKVGRVVRQLSYRGHPVDLGYYDFDYIASGKLAGTEIIELSDYQHPVLFTPAEN